jgi:hypothetical protein
MSRVRHSILAWILLASIVAGPALAMEPPHVSAAEQGWELMRDENGIRSYKRIVPGSPLLAFRGEAAVDAPIGRVMSVLFDADRVGEWIPRMLESRVYRWIKEPVEYIQYTHFDAPWPVTDRIFLSHVTVEVEPETQRTVILYGDSDDEVPTEELVRGYNGGSYYILEPIDGGRGTWIIGVGTADPKGIIPDWLINWIGTSWPYDTLVHLRRQVARDDILELPIVRAIYKHAPRKAAPGWLDEPLHEMQANPSPSDQASQ